MRKSMSLIAEPGLCFVKKDSHVKSCKLKGEQAVPGIKERAIS